VIRLTKSPNVALLGEQAPPRVLYAPSARANSWEDVSDLSASLGLTLDPWQELALRAGLGERSGGIWAAHQVGVSAPRQNGKSQLIVARALAGALLFGERMIVVSAHQQDTARETFAKFVEQIEANPALESRIARNGIMNALNREAIKFKNGATVKFKARTGAGGRGFSSDCLFLDEAQMLGARAWASINSTMSAMTNPQVWLLGTPPTLDDDGEVFTRIRKAALAKTSTSLAWAEWGAEIGDDPALEETRAKANPAWSTRINHDVVDGEYDTYTPRQFALERLGIWLDGGDRMPPAIDPEAFAALKAIPPDAGSIAYGIKFSPDGARMSFAVALRADNEPVFVEVLGSEPTSIGLGTLVGLLASSWRDCDSIVIDGKGLSGALVERLLEAGVISRRISRPTWDSIVTANTALVELVRDGGLAHSGQEGLQLSVAGAAREERGRTGWGFRPNAPDVDVTPVEAVALAISGLKTSKGSGRGAQSNRASGGRVGSVM